jgi:GNAT superfamily N-acetyltransferase
MNLEYKIENSTVYSLKNDTIIGQISVPRIDFHWGKGCYVPLAGIAGVSTEEEFRSKGIASTMMELAKQYALEKGYSCSGVSTNLGNVARRLYSKAGYTTIFRPGRYENKLEKRIIPGIEEVKIRSFREGDEKLSIKLYNSLYSSFFGWRKKTPARWHSLRKEIRERDPGFAFLAENEEGVCGWAGYFKQWVGLVEELYVIPCNKRMPIARTLLCKLENHLVSQGIEEAHFWLSPQDEFSTALLTANGYKFSEQRVFMLSILDLPLLLSSLLPLFYRRIKENPSWKGVIGIKTPFQEGFLKIDGKVSVVQGEKADAELILSRETLTRLISGAIGLWDSYLEGLISVKPRMSPELKSLLEKIFPQVPLFHPADDLW